MTAAARHIRQVPESEAYYQKKREEGKKHKEFIGFDQIEEGSMTPTQYENAVHDMVNFFAYAGEPAKLKRLEMGIWVIVFLVGFLVISYLLKKEYWKDIH